MSAHLPARRVGAPPTAAERAAAIAREDAARTAAHRLPHVVLGPLGTSYRFRENVIPPLSDFAAEP